MKLLVGIYLMLFGIFPILHGGHPAENPLTVVDIIFHVIGMAIVGHHLYRKALP